MAFRRVAFVAVGVVVGLAALAVIGLTAGTRALEGYLRSSGARELSAQLGRPVSFGGVKARFLPRPRVELGDLVVSGAPKEPALVRAERAEVTVRLWPLLVSFGQNIEVGSAKLRGVDANLVRRADGTWNFSDIDKRLREAPPSERQIVVSSFGLREGTVSLYDEAGQGLEQPAFRLQGIEVDASDLGPGLPLEARAEARVGGQEKPVRVSVRMPRLPASSAELEGGMIPGLEASLDADAVPLEALGGLLPARLSRVLTGGAVEVHADLSSTEASYRVEGTARADRVRVRGEPARLELAFRSSLRPADLAGSRVEIHQLAVKGPGLDLSGTASVVMTPLRLGFDLEGSELDVRKLVSALPEGEEERGAAAQVSGKARQALQAARIDGSLSVERVLAGRLQATGLSAKVSMADGVLTAEEARVRLYGGTATLGGTRVDLRPDVPSWSLTARLEGVEMGELLHVYGAAPLSGRASIQLSARGRGSDWQIIRQELTGQGRLSMDGARLESDLSAEVARPLLDALAKTGRRVGPLERAAEGTRLGGLEAHFEIREGFLHLSRPLALSAPFGVARLEGRIGLDQRLDLKGTADLSPSFVGQVTGNQLRRSSPLSLPMKLVGTLPNPKVSLEVSPRSLVPGILDRLRRGQGRSKAPSRETTARSD